MTTLLEPATLPTCAKSVAAEYHAATADARTQIGTCWQSAAELARFAPGLIADAPRLHVLESLTNLLDALATLDLAVQTQPTSDAEEGHLHCWRSRYAEVSYEAQHAAVAAGTLLAHVRQEAFFAPTLHTIRLAIHRLQRHLDDIGHVLDDMHTRAA